jgi:hypothetical protein
LEPDKFEQVVIPLPHVSEQLAIAAYLDAETRSFDALMVEVQLATGLLQERRSALISAAVTGKIDVRGLVSTERGRHQERQADLPTPTDRRPNAVPVDLVAEPA